MRTVRALALSLALSALIPTFAHAQIGSGLHVFAKPYIYTDSEGPGSLKITPLSNAPTWPSWQKIQVTLEQNGYNHTGSGVYYYTPDNNPGAPPVTYLWYTLRSANGGSYFFEGRIDHTNNPYSQGAGTYWRVDAPQTTYDWKLQWPVETQPYVNSSPEYVGSWERIAYSEAINGAYYAVPNSWYGWNAQVSWSGTIPKGSYDVEVYLPAKWSGDLVGRTKSATYQIVAAGPSAIKLDQNVPQSGWVTLAKKVAFDGSYKIVLNNETGETNGAWKVVASAVRLTYAGQ